MINISIGEVCHVDSRDVSMIAKYPEICLSWNHAGLKHILAKDRAKWVRGHTGIGLGKPGIARAGLKHQLLPSRPRGLQVDESPDLFSPRVLSDEAVGGREQVFLRAVKQEDDGMFERGRVWRGRETADNLKHDGTADCIVTGSWRTNSRVKVCINQKCMAVVRACSAEPDSHVGYVVIDVRQSSKKL